MKKIHIFSHHGYAVRRNDKQFDIAMCGLRGNDIELSEEMSEITCSRCKKYVNEFNDYANNVIEFKIGDIYEKEFHRKYEIKKIEKSLVTCYILNSDFKRLIRYPKRDNNSKYEVVIMEKRRLSCYTKLKNRINK